MPNYCDSYVLMCKCLIQKKKVFYKFFRIVLGGFRLWSVRQKEISKFNFVTFYWFLVHLHASIQDILY